MTTILVGILVGLLVMIVVKPRLRKSIEGEQKSPSYLPCCVSILAILSKKQDLENRRLEEQPQLTKTEGRFETYTGKNEYDL